MSPCILVPAFNEQATIGRVLEEYLAQGLHAELHVLDNGSTDATSRVAQAALLGSASGHVHHVPVRGKTPTVAWALQHLRAPEYALVDADWSYPLADLPALFAELRSSRVDMVVGDRLTLASYRHVHGPSPRWLANVLGSAVARRTLAASWPDAVELRDLLSGLRVFTADFASSLVLGGSAFELEVELALHAARVGARVRSVPIGYRGRPKGSRSKLVPWADGLSIAKAFLRGRASLAPVERRILAVPSTAPASPVPSTPSRAAMGSKVMVQPLPVHQGQGPGQSHPNPAAAHPR